MKKHLLIAMFIALFMIVAAFAWGQSIFYEETFDANHGWTLDSNWYINQGMLEINWSPSTNNFDVSATSPDIVVPALGGDIVVHHKMGLSAADTDEIIVVAGGSSTIIWSYDPTEHWSAMSAQYLTLSLSPFAGQTIQLKFHAAGANTNYMNYWYIYDIVASGNFSQDLAALQPIGASFPAMGKSHNYVVPVSNTGLTAMHSYTVKLMQTGDVEIGSVAGTSINPGEVIEYNIPWIPSTTDTNKIWGKVVVDDENLYNNESAHRPVGVMESDVLAAEIGYGTATNTYNSAPTPYGHDQYGFRQQLLYRAEDLYAAGAVPGPISALAFNLQGVREYGPVYTMSYTISLKHTDQQALSNPFEPGAYTPVWYRMEFSPEIGWNTHTFSTPFDWDGSSNLIVDITNAGTGYQGPTNDMVYSTRTSYVSSLRADYFYANDNALNNRSNICFFMNASSPNPEFMVSPAAKNFGDVVLGYTSPQTFRVMNSGGGILNVNSISISGSPCFTITDPPALPQQIALGQHLCFQVGYAPNAVGNHTATITLTDNRRLTHTVLLSGNGVDGSITESGYTQNFDAVSPPALPLAWGRIYEAAVNTGYVKTVSSTFHNSPNCVAMRNPTDINTVAMLIAPPLAANVSANNVSVKFWSLGDTYSLKVGVMTDPSDAATFTEVKTFTLGQNWVQYQVSLASYTGSGKFIAFKHANKTTGQTIYIDHVEFEMVGANDLAGMAVTGSSIPNAGSAALYTVSVYNIGSSSQSAYTVKLFDNSGLELASAAGVTVAPGTAVDVIMSWTPATQGPTSIYGKVFLDGDTNPDNDASRPLLINVQPAGAVSITIGAGDGTDRLPLDFRYKNSIYQNIYYPAEIGMTGTIHAISLYNHFRTNALTGKPTKIWMSITTQQELNSTWIPSTAMTLVFDGVMTLSNLPTLPAVLPSGETAVFTVTYTPDSLGENTATISITDNVDTRDVIGSNGLHGAKPRIRETHTIQLSGAGVNEMTIGTGNQTYPPPLGFDYATSIFETIYTADEMSNFTGLITGLKLYNDFLVNVFSTHIKIWLGSTTQTSLQDDWISSNQLTLVFDGMVDFPYGQNVISIPFQESFPHLDGGNLVMMVLRPWEEVLFYTGSSERFKCQTIGTNRSRVQFNNENVYYPDEPPVPTDFSQVSGQFPKTTFTVIPGGVGQITGTVLGAGAGPLLGVQVNVNSRGYTAFTNVQGQFTLANVLPGNYAATFSRHGCETQTINIIVSEDETEVMNVSLDLLANVNVTGTILGSDSGSGIAGANIDLVGYENYNGSSGANGSFTIPTVFANHSYDYTITAVGYTAAHGTIEVVSGNYDMGNITLSEIAFAPNTLQANLNAGSQTVNLSWNAPNPRAMGFTAGFETAILPPADWPKTISSSGFAHAENPLSSFERANLPTRNTDRALEGYKVWRLIDGQEDNEGSWVALCDDLISTLNYVDEGWDLLFSGLYKWAVKAVYTSNVFSPPAFSNILQKIVVSGTIAGFVRDNYNQSIAGATVTIVGGTSASTNDVGSYSLEVPVGIYSVTAAAAGFDSLTFLDVAVTADHYTTLHFAMTPVFTEDEVMAITVTALGGNYPNPFNPQTTISYDLKDTARVRLSVYNVKGQLVRSLVNTDQAAGRYRVVFDGRDDRGNPLSSGIYLYRYTAGRYSSTRKMILMQ